MVKERNVCANLHRAETKSWSLLESVGGDIVSYYFIINCIPGDGLTACASALADPFGDCDSLKTCASLLLDAHSTHGRSNFRDERSSKTYERLQKKLKDRQGTQKDKMSSPPPSPQKCPSPISEHNGLIKGQNASGGNTGSARNRSGRGRSCTQVDPEMEGNSGHECLS